MPQEKVPVSWSMGNAYVYGHVLVKCVCFSNGTSIILFQLVPKQYIMSDKLMNRHVNCLASTCKKVFITTVSCVHYPRYFPLFRYVHSYQSYLWNHAASMRVQKYGMFLSLPPSERQHLDKSTYIIYASFFS